MDKIANLIKALGIAIGAIFAGGGILAAGCAAVAFVDNTTEEK